MSNSHTKFDLISSNGLGGDSITDGQTEAITIPPSLFFFKKRGDNYAAFLLSPTLFQQPVH